MIEPDKLDAARRRVCPSCGAPNLIPGPKGGASQNFYCGACRQGWNFHGVAYGIVGVERIGEVSDDMIGLFRERASVPPGGFPMPADVPENLYAYFIEGEDSFIATLLDGTWYPLVFGNEKRALSPDVIDLVNATVVTTGKAARLIAFKREAM